MSKLTIPQIRHCLLALAARLEVEPHTIHPSRLEVAGVLRYLAEETRRAPRGSRKKTGEDDPTPPDEGRRENSLADEARAAAE